MENVADESLAQQSNASAPPPPHSLHHSHHLLCFFSFLLSHAISVYYWLLWFAMAVVSQLWVFL